MKCLSEGRGDVAFAKDSTVDAYCANTNASENEAWCLDRDRYVALPAFGQAPSHPVMYNPDAMDAEKAAAVRAALVAMSDIRWPLRCSSSAQHPRFGQRHRGSTPWYVF